MERSHQGRLLALHQGSRQIVMAYSAVIICMKLASHTRNNLCLGTACPHTICSISNVLEHVEESLHQITGLILLMPPSLLSHLSVLPFLSARTSCMEATNVCTLCATVVLNKRQLSLNRATQAPDEGVKGGQ